MIPDYPRDSDGDALRRVANDGSDMSRPMSIDFPVVVPDEFSGTNVVDAVRAIGYQASLYFDEASAEWECICTKEMLATYELVVAAQAELDRVAEPFGGRTDGWGTFGNIGE